MKGKQKERNVISKRETFATPRAHERKKKEENTRFSKQTLGLDRPPTFNFFGRSSPN